MRGASVSMTTAGMIEVGVVVWLGLPSAGATHTRVLPSPVAGSSCRT